LKAKARWYLEHGVPLVWLVLPRTRETIVVTSGGEAAFTREECLPTSEHLPDLAPEVSRFFAQIDR
jgi:Uma2 family endonuclease